LIFALIRSNVPTWTAERSSSVPLPLLPRRSPPGAAVLDSLRRDHPDIPVVMVTAN